MDFSKPSFPMIDGGMQLTVTAADLVGYPAVVAPQTVLVTRLRWDKAFAAGLPVMAPALTPSGDLVVPTANAGTTGALYKLDGVTGAYDGGLSLGAIQGVAVSNSVVPSGTQLTAFLSYNFDNSGSLGALGGVNLDTMQLSSNAAAPAMNGHVTYMAPALLMNGQNNGEVYGVTADTFDTNNATQARVLRWGALNGADSLTLGSVDGYARVFHASKVPPLNAIALLSTQTNAFVRILGNVLAAARRIANARGTPMSLEDGAGLDAGATAQAGMNGSTYVSVPGGTLRQPAIVRVDSMDISVDWSGGSNNDSIGAVSIAATDKAFVGLNNTIAMFDPSSGGGSLANAATLSAGQNISLAPVLLAPRSTGATAWGYTVSDTRKLIAFDQTLSEQPWEAQLRTSSSVSATHPSFSCNTKLGSAKGTGVLFVGWSDGHVQAIIVDGPKLQGPWPKYQRSMGNAGNDDETNFPTNWPGICP